LIIKRNSFYQSKYYDKVIRVPFENTTIPVPIGFDAMLSKRYGDYMKLVRNTGGHDYPFYESQKKQLEALMDFKLADVYQDSNVLKMANEAANWLEEEKIDLLKILPDYERTSSVII